MKDIDRARGDYGLGSYLEIARQNGGKVEHTSVGDLTVVTADVPFFKSKIYVALREDNVRAGKQIRYDREGELEQVEYVELSDVILSSQIDPFHLSAQISIIDLDRYYSHAHSFTSIFHPYASGGMIVDVSYVLRQGNTDFLPFNFFLKHDERNMLTVDPKNKSAGFYHLAPTKNIPLPFPKLPFEVDGIRYSMNLTEDDNTFDIVQEARDGVKVEAGGLLAVSQERYDLLKDLFTNHGTWGFSRQIPIHYRKN